MEINALLSTIGNSVSRMKLKELSQGVESLKNDNVDLELFLANLDSDVRDFDITLSLMNAVTKLIDKKVPLSLVKNVFDQYSVMFIISILKSPKSEQTKLMRIYMDIMSNSAKFDIYAKVVRNVKLVSSSDSVVLELFWLLPLFSNVKVLTSIEYNKFISEMKETSIKVPDFMFGYKYFVSNPFNLDKAEYKQFLTDGMIERSKN